MNSNAAGRITSRNLRVVQICSGKIRSLKKKKIANVVIAISSAGDRQNDRHAISAKPTTARTSPAGVR